MVNSWLIHGNSCLSINFSSGPSRRVRCLSKVKDRLSLFDGAKVDTKKMRSNLLKRIR